jgi:transcriptional regulator with GAF, ATPase, and Fis domain
LGQLTEALARETATGEILRAISTSPSDLRAVLDTLVQAAARFCGAPDVGIFRVEGEQLRMAAGCGVLVDTMERQPGGLDRMVAPLTRGSLAGRAVLERRLVHVHDLAAESEDDFPVGRELQRRLGSRTTAAAPLLHDQGALGAIMLFRTEVLPFTGSQLGLLQTFAAQAVIAIENVRLFNETKEALDQQTATSEILRTIAQAQTDAQPVFDTIVRSVAQLCHATITAVFLTEGGMLYLPASYGSEPEAAAAIRARFPRPLDRETAAGTAILTRSVIHVPDVQEPTAAEVARQTGRVVGFVACCQCRCCARMRRWVPST